ncbi:MAG: response regulator [Gammaproteobacteria bacterium]|nr:response regulator [Gammaproteobacteria bacterium]
MSSILIIDDDKVTHSFISRALAGEYELISAWHGQEGLEQAQQIKPDLILLDVEMPGMNGYEVCELLKASAITKHTPVIFLSANSQLRDRMQGFEAGADDYIVKPFQAETLKAKLAVVGRYRKTEEELSNKVREAEVTAHMALSGTSELGLVISYIEASHSIYDYQNLANEFFKFANELSLSCTLYIHTDHFEQFFSSTMHQVPPLESELISKLVSEGRFFDFGSRTQINYPNISVLIKNMPLHEMDRYGRIKDLFPAALSSTDTKIKQIGMMQATQNNFEAFNESLGEMTQALNTIKNAVDGNQKAGVKIMRDMLMELDRELPRLGLESDQEQYLLDSIESAISEAYESIDISNKITDNFGLILKTLEDQLVKHKQIQSQMADFIAIENEEEKGYSMDVELF